MFKQLFTRILFLTIFLWMNSAMAIEEPKYEVISTSGDFEIRHYPPILIAETEVEGDMDEASSKGFRLIANYIFGNNQTEGSGEQSKIAMTAPVTVEPQLFTIESADKANQQAQDVSMITAGKWRVQFVMPSQYTLANIPKPKNTAVQLREVPSKYFLVLKYSGLNTVSKVQKKTLETLNWAKINQLATLGVPQLSRYDPPWTLPMFRRNEIMIEISNPNEK